MGHHSLAWSIVFMRFVCYFCALHGAVHYVLLRLLSTRPLPRAIIYVDFLLL